MGGVELERYGKRLSGLFETAPPRTRSETVSLVLWPLLSELGWSFDECHSTGTVDPIEYDLLLSIDSDPRMPAVLVAAEPATQSISASRTDDLRTAMLRSGIDRALYSNGRRFVLLVSTGSAGLVIERTELEDHAAEIAQYSRPALVDHCTDLDAESLARRRLAFFRSDLGDSITSLVERKLGPAGEPDDVAVGAFLETVNSTLAERSAAGTARASTDDESASEADASVDASDSTALESSGDDSEESRPSTSSATAEGSSTDDTPESVPPETDPEGEYVVRVFNERGSIGAVGHSTSAGALADAAAYFFERGLTGVRIPWGPDDDAIVLNDEPCDESGDRWPAFEQLPNGLYINTGGSVADRARRVEALAKRAQLRVMLTGDWQ